MFYLQTLISRYVFYISRIISEDLSPDLISWYDTIIPHREQSIETFHVKWSNFTNLPHLTSLDFDEVYHTSLFRQ